MMEDIKVQKDKKVATIEVKSPLVIASEICEYIREAVDEIEQRICEKGDRYDGPELISQLADVNASLWKMCHEMT